MSLSTLQAQLASLSKRSGQHPGSNLASSKRHQDAVGRGLHFSVQHGHSLGENELYKASLLYETARQAADVPLQTLQDNCQTALNELAHYCPDLRQMAPKLCGPDQAKQKTLQDLLLRLSTLLAMGDTATTPCLHVLEYLLRRYSLHTTHMEDLLWALWPSAEQNPLVFSRCLQLIDLASIPSYNWLRPYAAIDSTAAAGGTDSKEARARKKQKTQNDQGANVASVSSTAQNLVPPRHLLAKHVMKHNDLLRRVCKLAMAVADLEESHKGTEHLLSFTAALVVEGLAAANNQVTNNQDETALRTIFSTTVAACGHDSERIRSWGYIVSSVLVERMELTPKALGTLTTQILLYPSVDSILAVMAVIFPPRQMVAAEVATTRTPATGNDSTVENSAYLTLQTIKNAPLLGAAIFPHATRQKLAQTPRLAEMLGHLYQEQRLVVAPFVAALIVSHSWNQTDRVVQLIQEPMLRDLWLADPQVDLVAAVSCWIVQEATETTEAAKQILQTLHRLDPVACERGIGQGIQTNSHSSGRDFLVELLRQVIPLADDDENAMGMDQDGSQGKDCNLLPPRVALEHATASVRLKAIERLPKTHALAETFLRRWASDEDLDVALAACKAVTSSLVGSTDIVTMNEREATLWTLEATYQWMTEKGEHSDKKMHELLGESLTAVGQVAKQVDKQSTYWTVLIELLVAHVNDSNHKNAVKAQRALLVAAHSGVSEEISEIKLRAEANKIVMECEQLWSKLSSNFSQNMAGHLRENELRVRARCATNMLKSILASKTKVATEHDKVDRVYHLCLSLLKDSTTEMDIVKRALEWCIDKMQPSGQDAINIVIALSSIGNDNIFRDAVAPALSIFVNSVKDTKGTAVSSISVLLEAATRPIQAKAVYRLTSMTKSEIQESGNTAAWLAVIPALSLIEDSDEKVRDEAYGLLAEVSSSLQSTTKRPSSPEWSCLAAMCDKIVALHSSSRLGNIAVLPAFLNTIRDTLLVDNLLLLCTFSLVSCGNCDLRETQSVLDNGWLPPQFSVGGSRSVLKFLEATESAGESAFPLLQRWEGFGKPVLGNMLKFTGTTNHSLRGVLLCVVRMLKGATISDPKLIISSGPGATGRRARSYSFGKTEGVSLLNPYPNDMVEIIVNVLSTAGCSRNASMIAEVIAKEVLSSTTWNKQVFERLPREKRKKLAKAVLKYIGGNAAVVSDDFFPLLPFDAKDLLELLKEAEKDYTILSLLSDFIRINASRLVHEDSITVLSMSLVELLQKCVWSDRDREGEQGLDYAILSTLLALAELFENDCLILTSEKTTKVAHVFSSMLQNAEAFVQAGLPHFRARAIAERALVVLCKRSPAKVAPILIPVILDEVHSAKKVCQRNTRTQNTMSNILPAYLSYAPAAGITLHALLKEFVTLVDDLEENLKKYLLIELSKAFASCVDDKSIPAIKASTGSLVATVLAISASSVNTENNLSGSDSSLAREILSVSNVAAFIPSLLILLQYAKGILHFLHEKTPELSTAFSVSGGEILSSHDEIMSFLKEKPDCRRKSICFINGILSTFAEALALPLISKLVKRSERHSSEQSLQLWQDLLVVQSMIHIIGDSDPDCSPLWNVASNLAGDSRELLQDILPVPIFLASATSIIKEGETDEIRSRALRLVADRCLKLENETSETALFLDLIPTILDLLDDSSSILIHSALLAVEHIARSVYLVPGKVQDLKPLISSLEHATRVLQKSTPEDRDADVELFCSSSLCCAALVRVVGPRSLPYLSKLLRPLFGCLSFLNSSSDLAAGLDVQLAQLAVLRSLLAIVETVPQFLPPHLGNLLSTSAVLSPRLRTPSHDNAALLAAVARLDDVLCSKVPSRLLVPALSRAMRDCTSETSKLAIISMLKGSIDKAPNSEVVAQIKSIFNAATMAFDHDGSFEERAELVEQGSDLFHALVLKLSEVQLLRLFSSFKEWRGDVQASAFADNAEKRYAFWTVCSLLGKTLRSIFLPCLTLTFDDAVKEIEIAAAALSRGKRDRDECVFSMESMRALQPLLLCLERSLAADAHQGGIWIRSNDNQKYESLLEPLGKFLVAHIPQDFPVRNSGSASSPFERLIQGTDHKDGSVIGCLTSLALAGGNEQLWKPLNHCVLEACGHPTRVEVRKGGLSCLLSLMKALGEEYMVLLPECLPVLSELLEDTDEEIVLLAKEIVSLAEELIGESLEDSLR